MNSILQRYEVFLNGQKIISINLITCRLSRQKSIAAVDASREVGRQEWTADDPFQEWRVSP